jgi:predicted porin
MLVPSLRQANMIRYQYGGGTGRAGANGFKFDATFAPGERSAASGNYSGVGTAYQTNRWFVGVATQHLQTGTGVQPSGQTFAHSLSAFFRPIATLKLNFNYVVTGSTVPGTRNARHTALGVEYHVGPHGILAEVARRDVGNSPNDAIVSAVGYDYHLSKRTTLYARALHVNNMGRAAVSMATAAVAANSGDDVNAYAVGIKHTF